MELKRVTLRSEITFYLQHYLSTLSSIISVENEATKPWTAPREKGVKESLQLPRLSANTLKKNFDFRFLFYTVFSYKERSTC